jgi:hypothetical protein
MKLLQDVNLTLTLIQNKLQFSFGEFVCFFVCFNFLSFTFHFTNFLFRFFHFLNTETKD